MKTIRALIVEDEHLARERVKELVAEHHDLHVVGEAANGVEAIDAIESLRPDVLLLDITLPILNGFDVLASVEEAPLVVFMTAYDEFAIRAFEVHAVDYLLKPIERERLAEALRRTREVLDARRPRQEEALRTIVASETRSSQRIAARSGDRTVLLRPAEIDCVEAVGNYSKIHHGGESIVVRQTLAVLEERLREHGFVRIQRSIVVNLERIAEIRRDGRECYSVVLSSGARFRLGERYRANLDAMLVRL